MNLRASGLAARYLSHFRAIHRGAYFAQLRTTTVRKLLPESWGFLCPVHTPDGAPCGLLSHLTATCRIVAASPDSPEDVQHSVTAVSARLHANAPRKVQLNLGCQGWVSREKPLAICAGYQVQTPRGSARLLEFWCTKREYTTMW